MVLELVEFSTIASTIVIYTRASFATIILANKSPISLKDSLYPANPFLHFALG